MVVVRIHNHAAAILLCVLIDSGGARSMIHRRTLPEGVNPQQLQKKMKVITLAGVYEFGGEMVLPLRASSFKYISQSEK